MASVILEDAGPLLDEARRHGLESLFLDAQELPRWWDEARAGMAEAARLEKQLEEARRVLPGLESRLESLGLLKQQVLSHYNTKYALRLRSVQADLDTIGGQAHTARKRVKHYPRWIERLRRLHGEDAADLAEGERACKEQNLSPKSAAGLAVMLEITEPRVRQRAADILAARGRGEVGPFSSLSSLRLWCRDHHGPRLADAVTRLAEERKLAFPTGGQ